MTTFKAVAPIFDVRDVDVARAHYERLGFSVGVYSGGGYAFATRDDVELHLGMVPAERATRSCAYLFVDDADALAATWVAAGVEVHPPVDTEWGMREGVVIDPDDNAIRFGSPL